MLQVLFFFFFKQKTAYEMAQCDWSSDVCSSDLAPPDHRLLPTVGLRRERRLVRARLRSVGAPSLGATVRGARPPARGGLLGGPRPRPCPGRSRGHRRGPLRGTGDVEPELPALVAPAEQWGERVRGAGGGEREPENRAVRAARTCAAAPAVSAAQDRKST